MFCRATPRHHSYFSTPHPFNPHLALSLQRHRLPSLQDPRLVCRICSMRPHRALPTAPTHWLLFTLPLATSREPTHTPTSVTAGLPSHPSKKSPLTPRLAPMSPPAAQAATLPTIAPFEADATSQALNCSLLGRVAQKPRFLPRPAMSRRSQAYRTLSSA